MIIFTPYFFIFLALGFIFSGVGFFVPLFTYAQFILYFALLLFSIIDYLSIPKKDRVHIKRLHGKFLSIGIENTIKFMVENLSQRSSQLIIRDEYPDEFIVTDDTINLKVDALHYKTSHYFVKPLKKGTFRFNSIYLRISGAIKLLQRQYRYISESTVNVYPNIIELRKFIKMIQQNREEQLGYKKHQIGQENEFDYLREYKPGDQYRKINWKAAARRRYPITQVDQKEHNNHIMVILDTGRMMTTQYGYLSKLDYAIDTSLILAAAANQKKDYFSLLTFSNTIHSFIRECRKENLLNQILNTLYKTTPTYDKSDYYMAYSYIKKRITKNTIIYFFSELYNSIISRELIHMLQLLSKTHRVHLVSFEEREDESKRQNFIETTRWILQQSQYLQRESVIKELKKQGIHTLRVNPQNIKTLVVNSYLSS